MQNEVIIDYYTLFLQNIVKSHPNRSFLYQLIDQFSGSLKQSPNDLIHHLQNTEHSINNFINHSDNQLQIVHSKAQVQQFVYQEDKPVINVKQQEQIVTNKVDLEDKCRSITEFMATVDTNTTDLLAVIQNMPYDYEIELNDK